MRALLFALVFASGACVAEEPDNEGGGGDGPDAGEFLPDAGPDEGVRLSVDGLPPETYWSTVPLFGRGPANGTVIIEGASEATSAELGVDGSFCIDIPLVKGTLNNLTVSAIDEAGERSDPQSFEISQFGEPPTPGEAVPARNIALGGLPTADSTVSENGGIFPALTDGSLNTSVNVENAFFSSDWMILRMPTPDGVESIRIYNDDECAIGDYLVHTAPSVQLDMLAPGPTNVDANPWTFRGRFGSEAAEFDFNVTDCSEPGYPCQEFNFDSAITGAIGIRFMDTDCGGAIGDHTIHEIEAWTPVGLAPPTVTAPSCQGGG